MTGMPLANSYRLQLPAGTTITLPDDTAAAQIHAVAVNELQPAPPAYSASPAASLARTVTLATPLQLVSPAYMAERNTTELRLARRITDLEDEAARLRNKPK
ncbi:MAG: hypothetical protein LBK99_00725 [Opitutaceae bacterium]|nr:hypothetical protein [Opitutaceae bacterium]